MQNFSSAVVWILAPQRHQPLVRKTQRIPQRSQMFLDQIRVEAVMAGGHRRVGGEDHFAGNARYRAR